MCNVIDLIVCIVQLIQIKNTVHVFHVDTVDTILYGIYALNVTNVDTVETTTCILGGLKHHAWQIMIGHLGHFLFGLFCSNLDTRDLETYPRTYSGHFFKYVTFWRLQGHLSTFQKMGGLRKSKFS